MKYLLLILLTFFFSADVMAQATRTLSGLQATQFVNTVATASRITPATTSTVASSRFANVGTSVVTTPGFADYRAYITQSQHDFGYRNAFFAYWITIQAYQGASTNVPLFKIQQVGTSYALVPNIPFIPSHEFTTVVRAVKFFEDGRPGWQSMRLDPPNEIKMDIGMNEPEPRWVISPIMGTYSYNRTDFTRLVQIRVR